MINYNCDISHTSSAVGLHIALEDLNFVSNAPRVNSGGCRLLKVPRDARVRSRNAAS